MGGGRSATVSTKGEFDKALSLAQKSKQVYVIEVRVPRDDVSNQLAQIAREVRKIRGTNNSSVKHWRGFSQLNFRPCTNARIALN